jgi:hypothetical protein
VCRNIAEGSAIYTDGLKSFDGLAKAGYKHHPRTQPARLLLRQGAKSVVPLADRAIVSVPPNAFAGFPARIGAPGQPRSSVSLRN